MENKAHWVYGERRRAFWHYDRDLVDRDHGGYYCSICKAYNRNLPNTPDNVFKYVGSKYCPNCGARMGEFDDNAE